MPDILKETISATEMAGLLGKSPYVTPWLLYQKFANGMQIETAGDSRMNWGTLIEPLILRETGRQLGLSVEVNRDATGIQQYVKRGLIGATRDATIFHPTRGPGACESKCVFDYSVWMQKWDGGKSVPVEIEIQLQVQMYVGDGETPYTWGLIPVFVCGDLKLDFERKPMPDLWQLFEKTAAQFFADVKAAKMPDPFGVQIEVPLLKELFPPIAKKVIDYRDQPDAFEIAELARMYNYHTEQASGKKAAADKIKAKLQGVMLDNEEMLMPHGIIVKQKAHGQGIRVTVYVPKDLPEGDISFFADALLTP